jgi:hypothetical protein
LGAQLDDANGDRVENTGVASAMEGLTPLIGANQVRSEWFALGNTYLPDDLPSGG